MKGRTWMAVSVTVLAVTGGLYLWLIWPPEIDACLDAGGCWDYCDSRCEHEEQAECDRCKPR